MDKNTSISAVRRLFDILEVMTLKHTWGIGELVEELKLPKATIHRFMQSLLSLGYVRRTTSSDHYSLSMKLFELGSCVVEHLDIVDIATKYMEELALLTGETIHLAASDGNSIVYLHKIPSRHKLQLVSSIGRRAPIHCTAIGKAIAAYLKNGDGIALPGEPPYKQYTERTILSVSDWESVLNTVRDKGYAVDNQEHEENICCFAAPLFDHTNKPFAGISVSIPTFRLDEEVIPEIVENSFKLQVAYRKS